MVPTMSESELTVEVDEPAPGEPAGAVAAPEEPADAPVPDALSEGEATMDCPGPPEFAPGPPTVVGPFEPPQATPIDDPMMRATRLPYELTLFIALAP
jgi:hypothetical protein